MISSTTKTYQLDASPVPPCEGNDAERFRYTANRYGRKRCPKETAPII
jgi:hypothetical protein